MKTLTSVLAVLFLGGLILNVESFGAGTSDSTQSVSGGGVTVKVTYLNPKSSEPPRFSAALDTHSVNLDSYELKSLAFLRDEAGKVYRPTAVENKGSGHHREVVLTFPRISGAAKRMELVIKDVAGVKERTFRWDLQ
ncbi:MAG: hypothetical protein ACM3TN_22935 [Alphaproteobacteria bacterium]